MQLVVSPNGTVRFVYADEVELRSLGSTTVARGSHVEPDAAGDWLVDLAPVDGPRLGPFDKRSDALQAEVAWLHEHWLTRSDPAS
jgi:hypothetical protein